jgi:hypothetical protein
VNDVLPTGAFAAVDAVTVKFSDPFLCTVTQVGLLVKVTPEIALNEVNLASYVSFPLFPAVTVKVADCPGLITLGNCEPTVNVSGAADAVPEPISGATTPATMTPGTRTRRK